VGDGDSVGNMGGFGAAWAWGLGLAVLACLQSAAYLGIGRGRGSRYLFTFTGVMPCLLKRSCNLDLNLSTNSKN
jgi:hypothetical protein